MIRIPTDILRQLADMRDAAHRGECVALSDGARDMWRRAREAVELASAMVEAAIRGEG